MQRPTQKPSKFKEWNQNTWNSSKTFSTLRSEKPSCLRGWMTQPNICYIDHHWDWEHLLQCPNNPKVKTTFLVALQGEIRNSVLQQAGKNKSAWLDSPALQDFCFFWWSKEPAQDPGCAMKGVQVWDKQCPLSLEKRREKSSEPSEQHRETHRQESGTPRAKPGLSQSRCYGKPPASRGCLEGQLALLMGLETRSRGREMHTNMPRRRNLICTLRNGGP